MTRPHSLRPFQSRGQDVHSAPVNPPPYLTTAQVAEAVGVSTATILRWSEQGALPRPVIVHGGRRGRMARWPLEAAAQARWVQGLLDTRMTWEEIREALAAGKFTTQGG